MTEENKGDDINERHKARMQRKKVVVDQKMENAQRDAGLIIVTTGNGKGKSSSGFGMVARALGHGATRAATGLPSTATITSPCRRPPASATG